MHKIKLLTVLVISILSMAFGACDPGSDGQFIGADDEFANIVKNDGYAEGKADGVYAPKKIGLRGGHSVNCKGAGALVQEYEEMQKFYNAVRNVLVKYGHTVINTNSNASSAYYELREGAAIANDNNVDLFVSLHMNAGGGTGTEAWIYPNSRATAVAQKMVNNFNSYGFVSRGVKSTTEYFEMNGVVAPNIILETMFVDNEKDAALWNSVGLRKLAYAVGNAIDSNIPFDPPPLK